MSEEAKLRKLNNSVFKKAFMTWAVAMAFIVFVGVYSLYLSSLGIFFLSKGETYLDSTSNHRGIGVGITLPDNIYEQGNITIPITMPFSQIKNITIQPFRSDLNKTHYFHIKKVFSPYFEKGHITLSGYEILTNLNDSLFTIYFEAENIEPSNVGAWVYPERYFRGYYITKKIDNSSLYSFVTNKVDYITITERINKCVFNESCQ